MENLYTTRLSQTYSSIQALRNCPALLRAGVPHPVTTSERTLIDMDFSPIRLLVEEPVESHFVADWTQPMLLTWFRLSAMAEA